jgi:hypothetical protein
VLSGGTGSITDTIISGGSSTSTGNPRPNCDGTLPDGGHNLESTSPSQCGFSSAGGDLIGSDPLLGPLTSNGGETPTMALEPGSPAIDAGVNAAGQATDQRGLARPVDFTAVPDAAGGDGSDIGAYELQAGCPVHYFVGACPSNAFSFTVHRKTLRVGVSVPGGVTVADSSAALSARSSKKKRKRKPRLTLNPSSASGGPPTIVVQLSLTKSAKATLKRKGKVTVNARITFTPQGGLANTQTARLKITAGKKHKKHKK